MSPDSEMRVERHALVSSTNDTAKELARGGCAEWTVVVAEEQSQARGRGGKSWSAPRGGLYLSVVLRPKDLEHAQLITLAAGLSVVEVLEKVSGMEARLKWPNDVLLDGKKVCGILTEGTFGQEQFLVVGVGLNVNQDEVPGDTVYPATSLKAETGKDHDLRRLEEGFLERFSHWYRQYQEGTLDAIMSAWKSRAAGFGEEVRLLTPEGELIAVPVGVTEEGALVTRLAGGSERTFTDGQISLRL